MRTNIDLDEALLDQAMRLSGAGSKRATVEEALRVYVEVKGAERARRAYARRAERLAARLAGVELPEPPSAILRSDRSRR